MTAADSPTFQSPFEALADYERRSLAHDPGAPEEIEAEGVWRGVGFRLGERDFLCHIGDVAELLVMPGLTGVPGSRKWVLGVANVRGNLVSVVDLNLYLNDRMSQVTNRSRVLLVQQQGGAVGLLVDEILGQRSLSREQLRDLDEEQDETLQAYVNGTIHLGDRRWTVFNVNALIEASPFQQAAV